MIEAMKQALEALEDATKHIFLGDKNGVEANIRAHKQCESLRQSIAEAEKQEQGEPVAEVTSETGAEITMSWWHEPALPIGTKLYTTPQQRTWVGLTDDEREDLYCKYHDEAGYAKAGYPDGWDYERAIEAKLKEKNT